MAARPRQGRPGADASYDQCRLSEGGGDDDDRLGPMRSRALPDSALPGPVAWHAPRHEISTSVGAAVARFALTGLAVLLLVGFFSVEAMHRWGRNEAIRDARALTELTGRGVVMPAVTPGLLRGDPRAIAAMDRVVRGRVLDSPSMLRVKLWDASGRVIYSDEHRLIGRRFPLPADERDAFTSPDADAELSNLGDPENRFERGRGKVMEVYLGLRGPGESRLLFETYQRYSAVTASGRRLMLTLLPLLAAALLLLAVLQVPLAWRLARRVKSSEEARLRLLEHSIDTQHRERRRIATDLHDGVVQNLAGISFRLGAARACTNGSTPPPLARAVDESGAETRESIRALRSLLVDIYPPSLQRQGLAAALDDLVARSATGTLATRVDAPADTRLAPATEALLFRAAQEGLRNVATHAGAAHVDVALRRVNGHVELSITDDGRGFDPDRADGEPDGHFGLVAIGDLVHDHGGSFRIKSAPGHGTTLFVEVPAK